MCTLPLQKALVVMQSSVHDMHAWITVDPRVLPSSKRARNSHCKVEECPPQTFTWNSCRVSLHPEYRATSTPYAVKSRWQLVIDLEKMNKE
jgi:hypothetical protein